MLKYLIFTLKLTTESSDFSNWIYSLLRERLAKTIVYVTGDTSESRNEMVSTLTGKLLMHLVQSPGDYGWWSSLLVPHDFNQRSKAREWLRPRTQSPASYVNERSLAWVEGLLKLTPFACTAHISRPRLQWKRHEWNEYARWWRECGVRVPYTCQYCHRSRILLCYWVAALFSLDALFFASCEMEKQRKYVVEWNGEE